MKFFKRHPTVPVLRFSGPIGMATPLRPGVSLATTAAGIEKAFKASKVPAVVLLINSPGGSPVQSRQILERIRALAAETDKKVYAFAEDVAASGGYMLALAGDEIYADPSSIVGSIGVISASFGFDKLIEKAGIQRRVYTAGTNKGSLDPFQPENADDVARLKAIQHDVHQTFIDIVRTRRGERLDTAHPDLFTGAFWAGEQAEKLGLIDGISDARSKMRELFGEDVKLKVVPFGGGGLLSRLRRMPRIVASTIEGVPTTGNLPWADDLLSSVETRTLWSRFGL